MLAAVEYDPVHAATHEFNFPHTRVLCGDISRLAKADFLEAAEEGWRAFGRRGEFPGTIDVVFGGPPCQGFSTIGKRLVEDERNQLVFHFFRVVTELRPRYFVMENVPGIRQGGHASILQRLIDEFQDAGYRITLPPKVLNAADYGAPQDRRRLFLLGAREDQPLASYPSPQVRPASKRSKSDERAEQGAFASQGELPWGPTVWEAIGDLPNLDDFEALRRTDEVRLGSRTLTRMERMASTYASRLREPSVDPDDLSYPRAWDSAVLTSSMRTEHTDLSISRFQKTKQGETEPVSRFLRLAESGLCNTLRAGTGSERGAYTSPRPIHPTLARVISVREAARLHSFPDWFRFHRTKWHGFRQVGNSVPPLLGRAVASKLVSEMGFKPIRPERPIELGHSDLLGYTMSGAADHFGAVKEHMPKKRTRMVAGGTL